MTALRKRYYIIFVARQEDGELRKIPIPLHYAYIFVAAAVIGLFTITGMAGSYSRMLLKTARFNQIRTERETIRHDYLQMEQVAHEKDVQAASLGSLASEVSALYGLRQNRLGKALLHASPRQPARSVSDGISDQQYNQSLDQLLALRSSAMSGEITHGLDFSNRFPSGFGGIVNVADAPSIWPVQGIVTSSFGARLDPFNGEGAFHTGIDIATSKGDAVRAPADGTVIKAGMGTGYGREVVVDHGHGMQTLYAHLSGFAVIAGQDVRRGDILGYVGSSGHSTGPHLHYEVRIHDTPVNPSKYLHAARAAISEHPIQHPRLPLVAAAQTKDRALPWLLCSAWRSCACLASGRRRASTSASTGMSIPETTCCRQLHRSFSYTGYWLNNPPGDNQQYLDRQARHPQSERFRLHDPVSTGGWMPSLQARMRRHSAGPDAAAAISAAKREGFAPGAIVFLDQEEGGRLLPEQSAYLFSWVEAIRASRYKPGVYCSGILVPDGSSKISTARDILSHEGNRRGVCGWSTTQCPPAPGCVLPKKSLGPASSGVRRRWFGNTRGRREREFARQCCRLRRR